MASSSNNDWFTRPDDAPFSALSAGGETTTVVQFLDLSIPVGSAIPMNDEEIKKWPLPTQKGEQAQTCLAALITHILLGNLTFYPHNRGKGGISQKTADSCFANLNLDVINEVTCGKYKDPIYYKDDNERLSLNGFHSRLHGILRRHFKGRMSSYEYSCPISIRFSEDFLGAYQDQGRGGSQHRSKDRTWCADLAYGSYLREIENKLGKEVTDRLKNKSTALTSMLYAMAEENAKLNKGEVEDWRWNKIYRYRSKAEKVSEERAGAIKITAKQIDSFCDAVKKWDEFVKHLEQNTGKDIKKLIKSVGLFGDFIVSHYGESSYKAALAAKKWTGVYCIHDEFGTKRIDIDPPVNYWPSDYKKTVNRLKNDLSNATQWATNLSRGNSAETHTAVIKIHDIVAGKKRKSVA